MAVMAVMAVMVGVDSASGGGSYRSHSCASSSSCEYRRCYERHHCVRYRYTYHRE